VGYETDIGLERRFSKTIKAILGNAFISQDPQHDKAEGTDFEIFTVNPFRVGVRLRRYQYWRNTKYREQFTIRWWRPSGVATEIHKIRCGLVDYILYGFVDKDEKRIIQWFIGDLAVFRENEPEPAALLWNKPPDSKFAAFELSSLPNEFVRWAWHLSQ